MAVTPGYRSAYPQWPDVRNERPREPIATGAGSTIATMLSTDRRREELKEVFSVARGCTRCPQLAATRTQVVFGAGHADADLMFVGEAPGAREDERGLPFVGAAGKMLEELLAGVGLRREDVFIANVLKCLRYDAMVQLGDGSWEQIGRLVRSRYSGTVMAVDGAGRLVARRVTGWHATPLGGRTVHRLTPRSAEPAGAGRVGIELTGDHPVLTERGYVRADELVAGDRVATGQGLSHAAFDVVVGTLLGDGSVSAGSSSLTMGHSARQGAYARFKASLLEELAPVAEERSVAAVSGGEPMSDAILVRTRAHRALRVLRHDFHRPDTGVPEWLAEALNARMLAIWFLDDGDMRIRGGGRQPLAEIAIVSFSDADLQILLRGLARLGLPAKCSRSRLYFDVPTSRKLSDLIAPYVPEPMRDKLHPDTVALIPFDEAAWVGDDVRALYDEVEVEDVTDRERADTTFFCIDVEDTHNFVTAGGVVHNCRPPGNRDPAPIEIENCQGYLFRQVELIQPKVICTLGNFSTKLLRADPTGITRVHGRRERRVIGTRAVWLYPIHHPAAALYTRSLQDTLREDFARLPAILAGPGPEQPEPEPEPVATAPPDLVEGRPAQEPTDAVGDTPSAEQLGLF
jgi:uracil-DNA glycosylase